MGSYQGTELSDLVISTPRLTLRPWGAADAPRVLEVMQGGEMHRFLPVPDPYTAADADAFVTELGAAERAAGTGLDCAIVERPSGRLVGSVSLRLPLGMRHADIGYWIAPDARGLGYASEATDMLARWAHGHGVHRVEVRLDVVNVASAHVALHAGFGFEGVRREFFATPSGRGDLAVFVRTPGDSGQPIKPAYPDLPSGRWSDGTVTLRDLLPEDTDAYIEMEQDPVTIGVNFTDAVPSRAALTRTVARARLDRLVGPLIRLAIVDTATARFGGMIMIRTVGPPNIGGIGYGVHPAFRGRGFTSRALRLLVDWAFAGDAFARLELGAKIDNVASQQAALHAGFEREGVRTSRLRNADGTFSDEARFALVNPRYASPAGDSSLPRRISP